MFVLKFKAASIAFLRFELEIADWLKVVEICFWFAVYFDLNF
jgi:hypothetical protein